MASAKYEKLHKCCCCHDLCWNFDKDVFQCIYCGKVYHKICHFPSLLNMDNNDLRSFNCIMCSDIEEYSKNLQKTNYSFDFNANVVISRIVTELYCKAENTDLIKSCPNPKMYPKYYEKIGQPMSLGNIKKFLEEGKYQQVKFVIWDMRRIFANAISYFPPGDPYHATARELNAYLYKMVDKWLPNLVL